MWSDEQRQAFNAIKLALQHAPVQQLRDFDKPYIVTTDSSHSCIGGVLSQLHDGHDLPVTFFSKRLGPHELNWPVHEKELFAIKEALMRWRHYVHGTPFDINTDNTACKWFLRHPRVSGRLARWLDFFAGFQFTLHHRPGVRSVVADALSRPPEPLLKPGGSHGDDGMEVSNVSVCVDNMKWSTCNTRAQSNNGHARVPVNLLAIPARDQKTMLGVSAPAETSCRSGGAQARMQLHATAVTEATMISTLQLSPETRKRFQKAYAKDPVFKKMWRTKLADRDYELL
ncbi:unnamed protein product [Phytophthora fragariaefolia]|uniref:Unnamed protein product n=1 Tax=Phytophthora fragariaefolia TaxID=1490495 RepID=A0A9W7CZW5_9STRA|nr:unnamed protein product [Phytophthora fragariaefolia]